MGGEFQARTGHLSPSHAAFLAKWLALVDAEEGGPQRAARGDLGPVGWGACHGLTACLWPVIYIRGLHHLWTHCWTVSFSLIHALHADYQPLQRRVAG